MTAEFRGLIPGDFFLEVNSTVIRIRFLTTEQREAYLAYMPDQFRMAVEVLIATGMRLGEMQRVTVANLKLDGEVNKIMVEDANAVDGVRPVFIPTDLSKRVMEFVEERDLEPEDRVFTHSIGWSENRLRKAHQKAITKAGAPDYNLDDHRHTAAVNLAQVGCPLQLIQQQLGLSTIQQTLIYARYHPDLNDVKPYLDRINVDEK